LKKILVTLLLISSMVFALAAAAMANSVYLDGMVNGKDKIELNYLGINLSQKIDFTSYALGTNFNCGKVLFNLEYAENTSDTTEVGELIDLETDTINFKCGYTLYGDAQSYLALTAGYHQMKFDNNINTKYSGAILGLKTVNNLNERILFEGSLGYSLSGTGKADGYADFDIDILLLQLKYSYFLTGNFGLGIGYKLTQYNLDDQIDTKRTMSGLTVGLTYKF
jgi:hypothetical protein